MSFLISAVTVVLMVLALIDVVRQPDNVIKNLPKIVWILLIVFIPLIGVGLWFLLGHDWKRGDDSGSFVPRGRRTVAPQRIAPVRPPQRTTEEQLADLEREEEHYRRMAEQQRRDRERPQDTPEA
ncbi:PLDc N-terminal domain-containing protein [Microbacteriaceae bacterium VKM Ac-2855]|nr:PLDc N-terminal domain-containing protein [Microbacteriaceae bacterium VKM Ac-2855]